MSDAIALENRYGARCYKPLPVVLTHGEGVYVWDEDGKSYLDMMGAYSAASFGHCHPTLVNTLTQQANRLGVVSRAYHSENLGAFLQKLCIMTGQDLAVPMNTGAEAVETALKAARKWAYVVKGVAANEAEIIVCDGNFHGRTISIVGFSSEPSYQQDFGPFAGGFKRIPFGDVAAFAAAITPRTAALLLEPIQGEGGIVMPPEGYLAACQQLCRQHNVLLITDEVQTGLGRTGKLLAAEHDEVLPDGVILGKALGGGLLPVSAFAARRDVLDIWQPGCHGSTFGGYPLAAAVGLTALTLLEETDLIANSAQLGAYLLTQLQTLDYPIIQDVRGRGLFIGVEINPAIASARDVCLRLMAAGILSKETHETVVRLAPPLCIKPDEIDDALRIIKTVLAEF